MASPEVTIKFKTDTSQFTAAMEALSEAFAAAAEAMRRFEATLAESQDADRFDGEFPVRVKAAPKEA